jgi:hypothetical protein
MSATGSGVAFENYDLKAEAPEARPASVRFAFEFPRLLADFRAADAIANKAKKDSRRMGYAAVALVLAALIIASGAPLWHWLHLDHDTLVVFGYVSAGLGLAGAVLAFLGMHKSSARRTWLRNRLKTEMLRQFHFQYLSARLPELASAKGEEAAKQAYLANRDAAYDRLVAGALADPEAELGRIAARKGAHDFRDVPEAPVTGAEDAAVAAQAFAGWRALRLNWQLGYAEAMLAHKRPGKRMSARQTEHAFSRFGWACVGVIVLLHVVQLAAGPLHIPLAWIETGVIWTALLALAARALEEGLQPQRDVERYEQYRSSIEVAADRFDLAPDLPARLEAMRAFERNSIEEMRTFMRTHARSRFML